MSSEVSGIPSKCGCPSHLKGAVADEVGLFFLNLSWWGEESKIVFMKDRVWCDGAGRWTIWTSSSTRNTISSFKPPLGPLLSTFMGFEWIEPDRRTLACSDKISTTCFLEMAFSFSMSSWPGVELETFSSSSLIAAYASMVSSSGPSSPNIPWIVKVGDCTSGMLGKASSTTRGAIIIEGSKGGRRRVAWTTITPSLMFLWVFLLELMVPKPKRRTQKKMD